MGEEETILMDTGESGCAGKGFENDGGGLTLLDALVGLEKTSATGEREG